MRIVNQAELKRASAARVETARLARDCMGITQGQTFLTTNHEMMCLYYEEALKLGYQADYGQWHEGGYFVEIHGCTLEALLKILKGATEQSEEIGRQLSLRNLRDVREAE
jgi:hypothetical protein